MMNKWLQDFTSRIEISCKLMATATVVALAIAMTTIIVQALRAARSSPVKNLKNE
jgi:putative ABC transport system permease protein